MEPVVVPNRTSSLNTIIEFAEQYLSRKSGLEDAAPLDYSFVVTVDGGERIESAKFGGREKLVSLIDDMKSKRDEDKEKAEQKSCWNSEFEALNSFLFEHFKLFNSLSDAPSTFPSIGFMSKDGKSKHYVQGSKIVRVEFVFSE